MGFLIQIYVAKGNFELAQCSIILNLSQFYSDSKKKDKLKKWVGNLASERMKFSLQLGPNSFSCIKPLKEVNSWAELGVRGREL